jgi:hypothetical protein
MRMIPLHDEGKKLSGRPVKGGGGQFGVGQPKIRDRASQYETRIYTIKHKRINK